MSRAAALLRGTVVRSYLIPRPDVGDSHEVKVIRSNRIEDEAGAIDDAEQVRVTWVVIPQE